MAGQYDNTNRGIMSRNERRREGKQDAEFTGTLNVDGVEYFLDAWVNERKDGSGKFFSIKVKPKQQGGGSGGGNRGGGQRTGGGSQRGGWDDQGRGGGGGRDPFLDDAIPF